MENAKKVIDASGLSCPLPIVKLSQTIKDINIGEVIEVIATDQSFIPDVQAWCRKMGHTIVSIEETEEKIRAFIKREK